MDQQFEEGLTIRKQVLGDDFVDAAFDKADAFTLPLQRKSRSFVTLAILTALGRTQQIKGPVRGALNNGATVEEIEQVLLHASAYCGVPLAVDAFRAAHEVVGAIFAPSAGAPADAHQQP